MQLSSLDWAIVAAFFLVSLIIGIVVARKAGGSTSEFFLSGRNMPWWLLGVSMVATTFSADTPNLVTDIVRKNGVSGNWVWWAFLLTGMLTVFVYARLWRRSGVLTDLEFYELRYGGKRAAFLRGFRALYLGVFFNVMIMATVCLAAIKIGGILLGISPVQTLVVAGTITVFYSSLGGLRGVLITDFFQFILAMVGTVWAASLLVDLPLVGGLEALLARPEVERLTPIFPDPSDLDVFIPLMVIPLAVQWWSVWYPGAEPGGGGYIAQRMLAAKDERHAVGATLFFNVAHYALRPWPWIIIALCSVVVFPDLDSIAKAFPDIDRAMVNDDLAYPAMLTFLPSGLLGLVIASLIAAFMSTISTHLNWGSSYVVNDFYQRFIRPDATEHQLVLVGRISTVLLMVLAGMLALMLTNALQAFNILLQVGAGTGLIFILRWFWPRINAWTEISGMVISFFVAVFLELINPRMGLIEIASHWNLVAGVAVTTAGWMTVTMLTPIEHESVLRRFCATVQPTIGWSAYGNAAGQGRGRFQLQLLCMVVGCVGIYSALFATGSVIYGHRMSALGFGVLAFASFVAIASLWRRAS